MLFLYVKHIQSVLGDVALPVQQIWPIYALPADVRFS